MRTAKIRYHFEELSRDGRFVDYAVEVRLLARENFQLPETYIA